MVWANVRSRATTARLASAIVAVAGSPCEQLADQRLPCSTGHRAGRPSALRSSGLDSTSRANRNSASSVSSSSPAALGTEQLGPDGLPLQRRGEASGRRPSASPPPRATSSSVASETFPSSRPCTRRCRPSVGDARIGQRAPQRRRGVERVHHREQLAGDLVARRSLVGTASRDLIRASSPAAQRRVVERSVAGARRSLALAHDVPAGAGLVARPRARR